MTYPDPQPSSPPAVVLSTAELDRAIARSRADGPWSMEHLGLCWWWLSGAAAFTAVLVGWLVDMPAAVSIVIGTTIVGVFFTLSTWVVAKIGAAMPTMALAAALGIYLVKIVALGVVIILIPADGYVSPRWMSIAVIIGLFVWLAAHLRFVYKAKVFYVDPNE